MSEAPLLEQPRVVLVPVANPRTAPTLLRLASELADPQEGKIIALTVSLGDVEAEAKSIEALEPIVKDFQEQGYTCVLETEIATSISRGILDAAREHAADLLIIGLQHPTRGQVALGTVAESVIETAPCDVLIYRAAQNVDFRRVVVPVDGTLAAKVATRTGLQIAQRRNTRIEALYVQGVGGFQIDGLARIEWSLEDIPGRELVRRTVVSAPDVARGILSHVTEDDLLVVGFSERTKFERWLFGSVSSRILNRAPGPVILVARSAGQTQLMNRMRRRMGWIMPTLTRIEQDEISRQSQEMAAPSLDYFVLLLVSAMLASLGLLLNSAAVIIGAMLVAPLMQPLMAFSAGLATAQLPLTRRASLTLVQGVLFALLVAVLAGRLIPPETPTTEMLARGNPSLLDAAVALASGFVAAYATARKDIPAALAGVAIAAALMPPLCTVGLGFALQEIELGLGAALLFLTNIICIVVAGWAVYFWLGMRPNLDPSSRARTGYRNLVVAVVLLLVVVGIVLNLTSQAQDRSAILAGLRERFPNAQLVEINVEQGETLRIVATLRSAQAILPSQLQAAQETLSATLGKPVALEVIFQRVIQPPDSAQPK